MVANGSVLTRGYYLAARFGALFYSATELVLAFHWLCVSCFRVFLTGVLCYCTRSFWLLARSEGLAVDQRVMNALAGSVDMAELDCCRMGEENEGKIDLSEGSTGQIGQIGQISLRLA